MWLGRVDDCSICYGTRTRGRMPAFRSLAGLYFSGVTITVEMSITLLFWNSNRKNDDDYMEPKVSHGAN